MPTTDEIKAHTLEIDAIGTAAATFLMELYEQWTDPMDTPEAPDTWATILDMADRSGLTLGDFYRP